MAAPRVLYLHANSEDYLADSLLHGLREVLGADVVDVPRRDALYDDLAPERRRTLYGRGFTLYGRMPDVDVDREGWLQRTFDGEFGLVVLADIWRYWAPWVQLRPHVRELRHRGVRIAAIDGGDGPVMYPYGPTWWRQMRPWPLPRAHGHVALFKRELTPTTAWVRYFGVVPSRIAERRLARSVHPISFSIPAEHLAPAEQAKTALLATHVVDPDVAAVLGRNGTGYAFEREEDYFADLRSARFGVTSKKAGWDCLRHYELAASGCVPCFRDLQAKPARCAPHGLNESNCVPYTDARDLLRRIEAMGDDEYAARRAGALAWAAEHTTRRAAERFLTEVGAWP
jgi:hypothetical protein